MTKLSWGTPGERFYETGIDQGVVYIDGVGVPWNGLVSIQENSSGGDVTPHYLDGVKYVDTTTSEEFAATLEAYSSPREFDVCDGTYELAPGLMVTNQLHKQFGLTYRTRLANDTDGIDHGYKIHIIYNATVSSAGQDLQTISESVSPSTLSWPITAIPQDVPGHQPTAHFIVESTRVTPEDLATLEEMLYGSDLTNPYLPTIAEIITLFTPGDIFVVIDNGDGTWTVTAPDAYLHTVDATTVEITTTSITYHDVDTYTITSL